ncbi:uncharacterized protein N7511_006876 [Penicillium nucicola]|uniref:uncharacterized protein n=1 Tax=Penicillium nucicola TaxID=1850975 RepID=UPI00254596E2|nr:uncharacterized protein N7511_006876 [Penicillium nucicola]KAJ5758182.1 hypothetical protein N7511_006876 [Penicillium nucicola]
MESQGPDLVPTRSAEPHRSTHTSVDTSTEPPLEASRRAPPAENGGGLLGYRGLVNTFGVFQSYYEDRLLSSYSSSSISWIGTVQGFLLLVVGVVVGPLFDRGYVSSLIAIGTFLVVFGLMMTSLSTEYYQIFLAHGVAVGMGCACVFLPSVAVVATYFTTHRALAMGITAAGGSTGATIYPIMFHRLVGTLGFPWTTRVIAFVVLSGLAFSLAVMRVRAATIKPKKSIFDFAALKEPAFCVFCLGLFFTFVGLYFPFFYLPDFFASFLHSDNNIAFYSISIINATSALGRISPGFLADRIGAINTMLPITVMVSVLAFAWIGIRNEPGTIVFTCLYGFASGAVISLQPTIVAALSPGLDAVGARLGVSFLFAGLGLLIGNPIAGTLLDLHEATFWKAQIFSASTVTVGTVFFAQLFLIKWKRASD